MHICFERGNLCLSVIFLAQSGLDEGQFIFMSMKDIWLIGMKGKGGTRISICS